MNRNETKEVYLRWFGNDALFGTEVDVDDALAIVRRAHGQVFIPIFIDISKIGQRESKS